MIPVEERSDTTQTKNCAGTFCHVHSICNVLKYGLTTLDLISEKSANFHKHSNGEYFLNLILNIM